MTSEARCRDPFIRQALAGVSYGVKEGAEIRFWVKEIAWRSVYTTRLNQ